MAGELSNLSEADHRLYDVIMGEEMDEAITHPFVNGVLGSMPPLADRQQVLNYWIAGLIVAADPIGNMQHLDSLPPKTLDRFGNLLPGYSDSPVAKAGKKLEEKLPAIGTVDRSIREVALDHMSDLLNNGAVDTFHWLRILSSQGDLPTDTELAKNKTIIASTGATVGAQSIVVTTFLLDLFEGRLDLPKSFKDYVRIAQAAGSLSVFADIRDTDTRPLDQPGNCPAAHHRNSSGRTWLAEVLMKGAKLYKEHPDPVNYKGTYSSLLHPASNIMP